MLVAFFSIGVAQQLPWDCPSEDARPSVLLAYLKRDRAGLDPGCIQRMVNMLGIRQYKPAIPVLIDYLDVKEPVPFLRKLGPTGGMFPAADALEWFGDAAVPALKKAILDGNKPEVARLNAASVYIFISRGREEGSVSPRREEGSALAFVAKAARNSTDSETGKALMKLAQDQAKYCFPEDQKICEDALREQ